MREDIPLKQIIDAALTKIKGVADVNTVFGDPLDAGNGVTVIPFSKISVGFASGGVDFDGKNPSPEKDPHFAGGNGAGVSVVPMGFLVIDNGDVRLLDLKHPEIFQPRPQDPVNKALDALTGIADKAPELVEKIKDIIADVSDKMKEKKDAREKAEEEPTADIEEAK